jgi:hypothetical protein
MEQSRLSRPVVFNIVRAENTSSLFSHTNFVSVRRRFLHRVATPHEIDDEHHQRDNQQQVDKATGYIEQQADQPQGQQNY